ncbi:hypothetical protein ACI2L4_39495 [Streptomyces sparsogenes]|uniref:hypothetical protein n=1 Tax=Streptomyces sparsogenes TaxID=67365 RepID=UPI00384D83F1
MAQVERGDARCHAAHEVIEFGVGDGPGHPPVPLLQGRADASGRSLADVRADVLCIQSLKHFTDPDDIAALALFLASDNAKSSTGNTLAAGGGSKAAQ